MKFVKQSWTVGIAAIIAGAALVNTPRGEAADVAVSGEVVAGTWQQHKVKFNYFGITSLYTCDGLEDHVKSILLHFGARKDAKVFANGCARGPDRPSPTAFVDADFYTLAPATDSTTPDTVKAQWVTTEITPRRPYFMGDGDCELVEQMKDLLAKNFTLRELKYRTDCIPHDININGYGVKADVLKALPAPKTAKR